MVNRWPALPEQNGIVRGEQDRFNLGAAKVDTNGGIYCCAAD
jgi:hypothetical protein